MKKVYVTTSGFSYKTFYPGGTKSKDYFKNYIKYFTCVEINNTYYHIPDKTIFKKWYLESPKNFKFVIKVNHYLTHSKRLNVDQDFKRIWKYFYNNSLELQQKLSCYLWQLPATFKFNELTFNKLIKLGEYLKKFLNVKHVFEFRHKSMFCDEIYSIFKKNNWTICINDYTKEILPSMSEYPFTSNKLVYIRLHGTTKQIGLYTGSYKRKLKLWTEYIINLKKKYTVIICFNNTDSGSPPDAFVDATSLINLFPINN